MMRCVAACCGVLQKAPASAHHTSFYHCIYAVWCSVLRCVAAIAVCCSVLQRVASWSGERARQVYFGIHTYSVFANIQCCSHVAVLQCVAVWCECCSVLQMRVGGIFGKEPYSCGTGALCLQGENSMCIGKEP